MSHHHDRSGERPEPMKRKAYEAELEKLQVELVHREPPPTYDQPERRKRMRRIVGWTTAGLALVGGGVAAYFLTRKEEPEEFEGSLGPNVTIP